MKDAVFDLCMRAKVMMINTVLLFLLIFNVSCFASDHREFIGAEKRLQESVLNYSVVIDECKKNETVLEPNIFDGILITVEQKRDVLRYWYFKWIADCSEDAVKEYLLSSAIRIFSDRTMPSGLRDGDELIVANHISLIKAEADYNAISIENRDKIGKIESLKKNFDPIRSAEVLGLE